ncbi:hypothetical protein OIO90_006006 [Microbotryomycetes sp. JL221]|nr:hypothetical protein OIO90_006006 [Microbotryomycetes sp. JL221]
MKKWPRSEQFWTRCSVYLFAPSPVTKRIPILEGWYTQCGAYVRLFLSLFRIRSQHDSPFYTLAALGTMDFDQFWTHVTRSVEKAESAGANVYTQVAMRSMSRRQLRRYRYNIENY